MDTINGLKTEHHSVTNGYHIDYPLVFFVNGKKIIDPNPNPECTLLTYLRQKLHLCGTKLGCGEGGCGACTVMLSKVINREANHVRHVAINACLMPICACHGYAITTVEGIGSSRTRLHPVQERIAKAHGSQCGFCTPGIVMSMYSLLRNLPSPSMTDLEVAFQGNLCRCTGYRPIIDGYRTFTKEFKCGMGDKCCKINGNACESATYKDDVLFKPSEFQPFDPSQEPIFPPELLISNEFDTNSLKFHSDRVVWYRPTKLDELLHIKLDHPSARIVIGNTEIGVEMKFKHSYYPVLVLANQIKELTKIKLEDDGIEFGASVTLSELEETLLQEIEKLPENETRLYKTIIEMLSWFAGKQIRNVASLGGNIMTGSPISDLIPIFAAVEMELKVASVKRGTRYVKMNQKFFTGYRKNILEPDEILISMKIPKTSMNQYCIAYKQAKRRDDDIAIVNMAINVTLKPNTEIVESIRIVYGGLAPTVVIANTTATKLIGKNWDTKLVEVANQELINEIILTADAPGGMILYRKSLSLSLFFKSFIRISQSLASSISGHKTLPDIELSGAKTFHTLIPNSSQVFERVAGTQLKGDPVGRPLVHRSALKQASGEAQYCDDIPKFENELYLSLVVSTKAHAKIISIDETVALQQPGVHAFFSAKNLSPKQNVYGIGKDAEVFASETVKTQGQIIGAIVADNQVIAQRAARLVKIEYKELPIIITVHDAIKHKSYYDGYPDTLGKGDVEQAFGEAAYTIDGEFHISGQEHFYLETQATIAIPRDGEELEIISSTQSLTDMQYDVCKVTELPANRVNCKTKRIGGGFGGKETNALLVALPVAFAARKLNRPVRCMLDRDEDMLITGGRNPFYFTYKACANSDFRVTGCDVNVYCNAGYTKDLSAGVLTRAMTHVNNAYNIENIRTTGYLCKTNLPSNTAFRAFGAPQGMMVAENIIRDIARVMNKPAISIMELHLFKSGDLTSTNQELQHCTLTRCWSECLQQSNYYQRLESVNEFNRQNRWRKRGISVVPTTYGVGFSIYSYMQAGALVNAYTDGSILLSHSGVEMGQGLHTKMIQIAARVLNVDDNRIFISETATNQIPNTTATAASIGSDLNGMAVMNACEILAKRLDPYRAENPNDSWDDIVNKAYLDRIPLSATGFYPNSNFNFEADLSGSMVNYFAYGTSVSEVEIDCLTGDHQVIRTDIVMDVGSSLNPAIDIGQIEGAYMQGYGLYTLEEMVYSPDGTILSRGPGMYKLPGFADIPAEFNVSILKGAPNPRAVYSSKAIGEPPLFLSAAVFFAIKEAITAARAEENLDGNFELFSPATAARIRMACQDSITKHFKLPEKDTYRPWNVIP